MIAGSGPRRRIRQRVAIAISATCINGSDGYCLTDALNHPHSQNG
ncbi:MAG: hypothetical protein OIF57_10615 [Marinobacterium sp.]|nr:hypothetical protein [Marinobacterium sp.]